MQKIKEFREQRGLTQSELADKAGLSLRTIQRIESGQTIPKGHTLTMLSHLLEIAPSDLINSNSKKANAEQIDQLKLINLSSLAFMLIPFGNVLFPFILWRKYSADGMVNRVAKYILNFQFIWTLLLSFLLAVSPFMQKFLKLNFPLILFVLLICYCLNIFMVFRFARLISKGDLERLKVTYQLL